MHVILIVKVQTFLEELEQQTGRNTKTVHNESGNGNTNKLSMDSALVTFNRKVSFQIVHPGCTLTNVIVTTTDKDTAEDCKSTLGERLRESRAMRTKIRPLEIHGRHNIAMKKRFAR